MKKRVFLVSLAAAFPLLFVAAVCGDSTTRIENAPAGQMTGIAVTGEGKVSAAPDMAIITLGVSALRPTVAEARDSAAGALQGMIDAMKAQGVAEKDIQTSNLNISPEYNYNGNVQSLRGFRVTNTLTAKVHEIDKTGAIVDGSVQAGGDDTTIQGIAFTIEDPESLREEARRAAVEDAKRKAQVLAQASGTSVGDPISIVEGNVSIPGPEYAARAADSAAAGGPTPIQPGELDVLVDVTVTWAIQ